MRFLLAVDAQMIRADKLLEKSDVADALADVETAIAIPGPLLSEAAALRVTINQTVVDGGDVGGDLELALRADPNDPTPLVQRSLEAERTGDVAAALADLDRALEIDPELGTALVRRALLLRRAGYLALARDDFAAAAALGSPYRRLALINKSDLEARSGDLRASFDDLLSAAREKGDLPAEDATNANAELLVRAGNMALNGLQDIDTAERLFNEALSLRPQDGWGALLGLGQAAERRGARNEAIEHYRRIIDGTQSSPDSYERNEALWRLLRRQTPPLQRKAGDFTPGFEFGIIPERASTDGVKRLALIIGSGNYTELANLPNARRDAMVVAGRLADLGFDEVEIAENLSAEDMKQLPARVSERAAKYDIVVVFYAGHGVETGGVNYLVPVDATLDAARDLRANALALADLTLAASKARQGALVIVDACRDDPFAEAKAVEVSRGLGARPGAGMPEKLDMGLAVSPTPPANSIVLHSTMPGKTAADGNGLSSPFVVALLQSLSQPGQSLDAVVRDTSRRVSDATSGEQVPTAYGEVPAGVVLPEPAPLR
ncbi:MAG: caspase family protein [Mesorhizobium sp.]